MIVSTIKQSGRKLTCDIQEIPAQYSGGLMFKFVIDTTYSKYVITPCYAYSRTRFLEGDNKLKGYSSAIEDGIFKVPLDLFKEDGYLIIAFALSNGDETIQTLPIVYKIDASISSGDILQSESTWQNLVIQTVDDRIALTFIEPMNKIINQVNEQQSTIKTQQEEIEKAIMIINGKIENNEFVPKHKWEKSVLYFSNPDGSWDDGFNITIPAPITISNIDLDTYDYIINTNYISNTTCTNGPLTTVVSYFIECLPIENGYLVRFTDPSGHVFTRKKINGVWDTSYSSPIY